MRKIKIVTDSAGDVPYEAEEQYGIRVLCFALTVDGEAYTERKDFTPVQFYDVLQNAARIPTTAQYTPMQFEEVYEEVWQEGYTDLIYIGINAKGSSTFQNSLLAKDGFYESHPEAKAQMEIHCVDSRTYCLGYGYPVIEAAKKARKGVPPQEILAYLENWFSCCSVYFTPYTLEFVKKSGRVSAAAAFVGELMGLKPIITFLDGESKILEKVRGEKAVVPAMVKLALKTMIPHTEYAVIVGSNPAYAKQLAAEMEKAVGYPPALIGNAGAAISINAGHNLVGLVVKNKNLAKE
ncbi:MAG: DegV family protein [Oscillospiraceae bacterium]|jgi:DegV family protein with EDD domain|nr:DegV family protein [Oscillospiraceae bacterium]